MVYKERLLTSLGGDDTDVVPMLTFPVQFHGCGDEAGVWGDTKQGLWVRLRINGEPGKEKIRWEEKDMGGLTEGRESKGNEERAERSIERKE